MGELREWAGSDSVSPQHLAAAFSAPRGSLLFSSPVLSVRMGKLILTMPGEFISQAVMATANPSLFLLESHPLNTSSQPLSHLHTASHIALRGIVNFYETPKS